MVRELRPRVVVLENVAALLTRGLDRVLGTLAEIGFGAEWHCIPASAVGAPHIRDRVFVVAYASRELLHWGRIGTAETRWGQSADSGWWITEPDVGRVAHGIPARVDRLRGLGNAVVPQVTEVIGRRVMLCVNEVNGG